MKTPLLKSSPCLLVILMAAAMPLQAQETKNGSSNPFLEKGTVLTGVLFGFTKPDIKHDIYNQSQQSNVFAVVGVQLDALYFVTDHIGVGSLLSYQSLYPNYHYSNYSEWSLKYGVQAGGYLPFQAIFNGNSRSQLFLKGGISWLKQDEPTNYRWGYKIGIGTLLPVGKKVAVELALNYLARSKDRTSVAICGVVPPCLPPRHDTVWQRNITLTVGFKAALF